MDLDETSSKEIGTFVRLRMLEPPSKRLVLSNEQHLLRRLLKHCKISQFQWSIISWSISTIAAFQKLLTESSHALYEALDQRVFFKSATIVIPKTWRDSMCQTVIHTPKGNTPYRFVMKMLIQCCKTIPSHFLNVQIFDFYVFGLQNCLHSCFS